MKSIVNSIDEHVGRRLRLQRLSRQMTVERLAKIVGASSAQIEAYEAGTVRVGADKLLLVAAALNQSVDFFFKDARAAVEAAAPSQAPELLLPDDAIELLRAFANVRAPSARRTIINLTISLSTSDFSGTDADSP
jgi:transcriptional regulator with XRE-family HTH domain